MQSRPPGHYRKERNYVAPAALPHQKGKWAVWKDGAQLQGTVKESKEEAEAIAKSLNAAEQKQ